jgi:hypothetical protein
MSSTMIAPMKEPMMPARADDGADDAGGLQEPVLGVVVEEQVAEESAHEGSDNPEDDGHKDRHVLTAGHDQPCEGAGDQSDDDQGDDESEHGEPFRWRTRPGRLVRCLSPNHPLGRVRYTPKGV